MLVIHHRIHAQEHWDAELLLNFEARSKSRLRCFTTAGWPRSRNRPTSSPVVVKQRKRLLLRASKFSSSSASQCSWA